MTPSGFIYTRFFACAFLVGLTVSSAVFGAPADEERSINLRERIKTLEGVIETTKAAGDKTKLSEQLQRLQRELALLDERQAIEARERQLHAVRTNGTLDVLREKLRSIDVSAEEAEARVQQIAARRKLAAAERDTLSVQVTSANNPTTGAAAQALLQEKLFTKTEELRVLAMERESAEGQIDLAHETEQMRKTFKDFDEAGEHPSLRVLFEKYTTLGEGRRLDSRFGQQLTNLEQNLKVSQSALELAQQKLGTIAGDLALLEKQTGIFNRNAQVERLLAEERSQKDALTERITFFARQVEALKRAQVQLTSRQELAALNSTLHREQFESLKTAYLQRLRWPAVALTGMILIQILAGYLLLPLLYKNESLVLARRLIRYILVVAATIVVARFLFDDIKMVAAAGGLVSAAIVISLQDVCASIFAWFVIMLSGKFGIGDRLEIDGTRGDVIDIDLLRTTLLEVNGWLGTDQSTGRVITVPNNFIFKTKVFNFTHGHPFIWGKIDLTVNAATPVAAALTLFERVLEEEAGEQFAAAQAASVKMRRRYGVEDAVYKPNIDLTIVDTGVLMNLFYVAHYRQIAVTRNKIARRLIAELERHPHIQLSCPTLQILHDNLMPGAPSAVMGSSITGTATTAPRSVQANVSATASLRN
ncbi:MAG: mechanosensitive ion channel domain-containing protein [Opitutaceae bacterium]